jgi:ATP-dependent helicase HrpA
MLRDQFWLRSNFGRLKADAKKLEQDRGKQFDSKLKAFLERFEKSKQRHAARLASLPQPKLDESLPIAEREAEIAEAIRNHQVVVISGETGSGKSTQLPLIALKCGFGVSGTIGHTQPRRIAARSVAARVADQIGSPLGQDVGFKIRFTDQSNEKTFVKLMTDGIMLAETQSDRFLDQYDLIIIDEAHERSLNIDFLLGSIKRILEKRKNLRLIITSATINTQRFADHFTTDPENPVPVINVEGRTYPVEIRYQPPQGEGNESQSDTANEVVKTVRELSRDEGDMLIFLPTEADIRDVSKKLKGANLSGPKTEVLPLYARLSTDQQNTIFKPGKARRIVLATNVAESSITVPRIRFVIDTGTARISRYAAKSKVQRLPIEAISQASAKQRAGRCGRIGPGICIRLYDEEDFETRSKFTTPEIRRTNLASVILQTLSLKLGAIDEFPFIDPPLPESIRDGFKTLFEVGAVDDHRRLTPEGRKLARLPVDPRIGKMIYSADQENCLAEILIIASALELQNPRVRPAERRKAADEAHKKFAHEKSDFLSILNVWDFFHELKSELSKSKLRKACEQNFLSFSLMKQWQDIHRQLKSMVSSEKLHIGSRKNDYNAIHRSLMTGLLSGVAMLGDRHEYTGAGGIKFHLWPGSDIFESKPKWIIAAEIVETTRRYGRTVAKISPDWVERLASHLVTRRHTDMRWSKKKQSVVASEHVALFGLPIVVGRQINYGPIDAVAAREIFIERGLCGDEYEGNQDFFTHNQWLVDELTLEAAKTRDRDLVVDPYALQAFYEKTIPEQVFDLRSLDQALKKDQSLDQTLRMTRADVLPDSEIGDTKELFPDEVQIGSMQIPIEYKFAPGDTDDGATVKLPIAGIGQLDDVQAGWLIPGLLESRIVELIRSLPKPIRRLVVPAPETAQKIAEEIEFGKGSFRESVAMHLSQIAGQPIRAESFKLEKLSPHLNVNVQVVDDDGSVLAEGRSVSELRQQLGPGHVSTIVEVEDAAWKQDGLREWNWGDLPTEVTIARGGTQLSAYPAIVDQGDAVGLRLTDSRVSADATTRQGLVRLFQIVNRKNLKSQVNWLPDLDQHAVALQRICNSKQLRSELADLITHIAFVHGEKIPRTESDFQSQASNKTERVSIATQDIAKWLPRFAKSVQATFLAIENVPANRGTTKGDIKLQIANLTREGYLSKTSWIWLKEYPRFFDAIAKRIDKLSTMTPEKDRSFSDEVGRFWQQYEQMREQHEIQAIVDPELEHFRWMVEEYRVSLFAQGLGTSISVSSNRLENQWKKVRKV